MDNIHIATRQEIDKIWDSINSVNKPIWDILKELKKQYGIVKLTFEVGELNGNPTYSQALNDGAIVIDEYQQKHD